MILCVSENQIPQGVLCFVWQLCLGDLVRPSQRTCVGLPARDCGGVWLCGTVTDRQCDGTWLSQCPPGGEGTGVTPCFSVTPSGSCRSLKAVLGLFAQRGPAGVGDPPWANTWIRL